MKRVFDRTIVSRKVIYGLESTMPVRLGLAVVSRFHDNNKFVTYLIEW